MAIDAWLGGRLEGEKPTQDNFGCEKMISILKGRLGYGSREAVLQELKKMISIHNESTDVARGNPSIPHRQILLKKNCPSSNPVYREICLLIRSRSETVSPRDEIVQPYGEFPRYFFGMVKVVVYHIVFYRIHPANLMSSLEPRLHILFRSI